MKKLLSHTLKTAVTLIVIAWIINKFGWDRIATTVVNSDYKWFAGGVLAFLLSIIAGAYQWYLILINRSCRVAFWPSFKLYYAGIFFNNFIFGMITGDAYRVASVHISEKMGKEAFAATFLDRLSGLIALSVFALAGGTYILFIDINKNKEIFAALAVLAVFITIIVVIVSLLVSRRLYNLLENLISRMKFIPKSDKILSVMRTLYLDRRDSENTTTFIRVIFISLVVQSLRILTHVSCAQALGIYSHSFLHYFFVVVPIIALLMIIPLPFGIKETAGGTLFAASGFNIESAIVMEFLASVCGVTSSLGGGILFITGRKERIRDNLEPDTPKPGS